jgi:hypothetical protein
MNGEQRQVEGRSAIVRGASLSDPEETVFEFCTEQYHPLQPMDVAKCFDENVNEKVETAAFLREGREMFISYKMPSFDIQTNGVLEEIKLFGIVRCGFDTMNAARLMTSYYRPVCFNTITAAQNWANQNTDQTKGKGNLWKGKGTNVNLLRDLGYWMEHVQENAKREAEEMKAFLTGLAGRTVTEEEVKDILFQAFPSNYDNSGAFPKQLSEAKRKAIEEANEALEKTRNGILYLFNGAGTAITPDLYGVLNATSEFFCHYQPSKKPIAESVMFGSRGSNTAKVMQVLRNFITD